MPEHIGQASMAQDGTVTLDLLALSDECAVGHGILIYPPDHPQYREILEHVGGLSPGEIKPVRPWPQQS
jgi:hypothetical protein